MIRVRLRNNRYDDIKGVSVSVKSPHRKFFNISENYDDYAEDQQVPVAWYVSKKLLSMDDANGIYAAFEQNDLEALAFYKLKYAC